MHAADSGITVQFWETGCLTLVRWEYRDSKHKFLKLVFKRSDKWSHSYVHAFTSGTMLGTWHYIKFYDCRSTSGWWLMTMTSGSMIIDPFPHLFFFFYCAVMFLVDMMFYKILWQRVKCSINPWIVVLDKVSHTENSKSYSACFSLPVMVNHWLKAVSLHQETSSLLKRNVPYWELNITLCCWYVMGSWQSQ